ncbi:hypothetical protein N7539_002809 [Penicillium diatomitis]|uniref:Enoyl reductase (ER) domain-containing protein n=1 Tax=Penicillium diatomitis TaxID=2819901 RepID=A0A9W9XGL2_9EURO|nr:uncharacterized protein N7539_002809 [Penicillium diatomitis]KAJ5491242.1 hypothetical protein N7539_002809 [Penicillium diatomitis]
MECKRDDRSPISTVGIEFPFFKGSKNGGLVEATGHLDLGPTQVSVTITHCGVCGTDEHFRRVDQGLSHEGTGTIVELGSSVHVISDFQVGDRVGMGWFHRFCGYCNFCGQTGRQTLCVNRSSYGSADQDQGCFGSALAWDISALYKIPESIASEDAGPLVCGGATVWTPLYDSGVKPGARVGVIGIGGLGHMAIQFASKMGLEVVVFSNTESKKQEALGFGASELHATQSRESLKGVKPIDIFMITTSVNPKMSLYYPILVHAAKVYPLTVSMENRDGVSPMNLINDSFVIVDSGVAATASIRVMLEFAARHKVRPQIEKFPMTVTGINDAMQKLRDGKMRYRGVLVAPQ